MTGVETRRLGPDSLTWRYFGDYRLVLLGPRAALLQNMLPELGQAVLDHSVFFADTLGRLRRSVPPILNTVYGGPKAGESGRTVRDFHTEIKGELPDGRRYHALTPEVYFWAHATFFDQLREGIQRFVRPLDRAEQERLYEESKIWYRLYGVSDRPMPETLDEFDRYWDRMLREELVAHKTARYGIGYATKGIPRPPKVPGPVWAAVRRPLNYVARLLSVGGLPARAREILELPWSERDERAYLRVAAAVRAFGPLWVRLPMKARYISVAYRAFARDTQPDSVTSAR